ncbi:MAG: molecular chaperone TorD family protein [Deltaproteobacteria bacterium]|nr:molecular chaperone TorD family protein [Deltaproteobacteria bacterium]
MSVAGVPARRFEVKVRNENRIAAARSAVYAGLADSFRYPSSERLVTRLTDGSVEHELRARIDLLAEYVPAYGTAHIAEPGGAGAGPDGIDVLYCSLFDATGGGASVSLHERDYGILAREKLWEDLFRCYTHFGIDLENGRLEEAPDHLTIELEFMHFLTFIEASSVEASHGVVLGERDFLERHLAAWVPRVCGLLEERSAGSVYSKLALAVRDFVSADRENLESRIHELGRSR